MSLPLEDLKHGNSYWKSKMHLNMNVCFYLCMTLGVSNICLFVYSIDLPTMVINYEYVNVLCLIKWNHCHDLPWDHSRLLWPNQGIYGKPSHRSISIFS